jgi:methyl-accepting chemotaxis protein
MGKLPSQWGTSIKAKLLCAFTALTLFTLAACAVSVLLFNQVERIFTYTVTHTVKGYISAVRLQEEARQLNYAAAAYSSFTTTKELEDLATLIGHLRESTDTEVDDLREAELSQDADKIAASLRTVYVGFDETEASSRLRVAAVEKRKELAAAITPTMNELNGTIDPQFFGDTLDLSISVQGDLIPETAGALRDKRAEWAAEVDRLQHILQFRVAASLASGLLSDTSIVSAVDDLTPMQDRFNDAAETMRKYVSAFRNDRAQIASLTSALLQIGEGDDNIFKLRAEELNALAKEGASLAHVKSTASSLIDELRTLIESQHSLTRQAIRDSKQWVARARITLLAIAIGSILASIVVVFWYVLRRVILRLSRVTHAVRVLASGDSSVDVPAVQDRDEVGDMARAIAVFQQRAIAAKALTDGILDGSRAVANAASQLSQAVSQVSDGSNIQLNALQQSANALEQSTHAITDVARTTQLAREQAQASAELAASGIDRMQAMVATVNAISGSSTQISRIAEAIQRIANQTNMLALNAAIEAAHAGEHGAGFSVVAEEVRKLAENSRQLAENISEQVQQAVAEAERGVHVAGEVRGMMHDIASGVQEGNRLIASIATAMEQQEVAVAGINRNIGELTRIGQSNATAAEEITATALDLSKLAERTRAKVDQFKSVGV